HHLPVEATLAEDPEQHQKNHERSASLIKLHRMQAQGSEQPAQLIRPNLTLNRVAQVRHDGWHASDLVTAFLELHAKGRGRRFTPTTSSAETAQAAYGLPDGNARREGVRRAPPGQFV